MKTVILTVFTLLLVSASAVSCKKETPTPTTPASTATPVPLPAANVTTYTGDLAYTDASGNTLGQMLTGTATITSTGNNTYTISFNSSVPSLTGMKFLLNSGSYATIGSDGSVSGVTIGSSSLSVGCTLGGASWSFTGSF